MAFKLAQWLGRANLSHTNRVVTGTCGKRIVVPPVHVQRGSRVKVELLLHTTLKGIPNDGGVIGRTREQIFALLVPLEGEDGPLVLHQSLFEGALARPNAGHAI